MIDLVILISIFSFIAHYIYLMGKFAARLNSCEENVRWIRDYLLAAVTDPHEYVQHSPPRSRTELQSSLTSSWCKRLDELKLPPFADPFEAAVKLSNVVGIVNLKKKAAELGTQLNDFLLKSGIYLYENRKDLIKR